MSVTEEESELSIPEEEEEQFNIGLYIGGRNADSQRHGRGWAILPNGEQYDGQYRKGRRHGMGLYVFKGGARYYGQYRCGHRSGRGMFIYPDGTVYEGNWRKGVKHGKGRHNYVNGDSYSGDWYRGIRHGVGIYTFNNKNDGCSMSVRLKSTWQNNIRLGPFELYLGTDDNCTVLHGLWDNLYPIGPAVFSFNHSYILMGFFLSSRDTRLSIARDGEEFAEEAVVEAEDSLNLLQMPQTIWFAQDICNYDYSLLPQEPVPLPLSDSELSVCSLSSEPPKRSLSHLSYFGEGEGEEEGEEGECVPCECEYSLSDVETESEPCLDGSPCAIEIAKDLSRQC